MKRKNSLVHSRRSFLLNAFSSCTVCCFAASGVLGSDDISLQQDDKHKFLTDSGMSYKKVYDFAFKRWYIPVMKNLMEQIGKEKFIAMLKNSSDKIQLNRKGNNINYSQNTLQAWSTNIKNSCANMTNILTYEVITDNDELFEMKFTECIWAKTFREAKASEIGYAGVCYQDYGMTKAFNPDLKLVREKTQMQGNDCCHFKWSMKA
jgi:hypothetical protein